MGKKKRVITISRQFGSGGRTIGRMVAQAAGIGFYDKELIAMVAKESGFSLEFVEETGEYSTSGSLLFGLAAGGIRSGMAYTADTMPLADRVHAVQSRIIREIAEKQPCVIVGRAADYILSERGDCLNVFIHAPGPQKLERAISEYGIEERAAGRRIERIDKARASHYRYYTGQAWGRAENYHLCLDSALGLEACRDIILCAAK